MQTEVTRRERSAARASQRTSDSSRIASRTPSPPATTRVSIGPRHAAVDRSGATVRPLLVANGSAVGATTSIE